MEGQSNGLGTAGFVLALINFIFSFIPFLSILFFILWPLGLIFSIIGIFSKPRGLAIAGLVLSLLGIILIFTVAAAVFAFI